METVQYPSVFDTGEGDRMIIFAEGQPSVRFPLGSVDVPVARKLRDLNPRDWTHKRLAELFGMKSISSVTNALNRAEEKHRGPARDYLKVLEKELGVKRLNPVDMMHAYARFCVTRLMMEDRRRPNVRQRRDHDEVLAQLRGNGLVAYGWIIFFNEDMREWGLRPRTAAEARQERWYTHKIKA